MPYEDSSQAILRDILDKHILKISRSTEVKQYAHTEVFDPIVRLHDKITCRTVT